MQYNVKLALKYLIFTRIWIMLYSEALWRTKDV